TGNVNEIRPISEFFPHFLVEDPMQLSGVMLSKTPLHLFKHPLPEIRPTQTPPSAQSFERFFVGLLHPPSLHSPHEFLANRKRVSLEH
ncbi:MAG: hypothetical protein O2960_30085, partial [Verrucomicrobia bacterium]|nr:hypothetical protein [Verrucomicrobiota bacterium]